MLDLLLPLLGGSTEGWKHLTSPAGDKMKIVPRPKFSFLFPAR